MIISPEAFKAAENEIEYAALREQKQFVAQDVGYFVQRLLNERASALLDPATVWTNILRGTIARPEALNHYEGLKEQTERVQNALDNYWRTNPDLLSAVEAAVNEANRFRIEALQWKFAATAVRLSRADTDISTPEQFKAAESDARLRLAADRDDWKKHAEQSDKELCQLQDALGCPCESRNYFCDCGWRGYNHDTCPKCGKRTHDDGIADSQTLSMERIRDLIACEGELGDLKSRLTTQQPP